MLKVNKIAKLRDHDGETLRPHDIFQLVAGTSTGGLIAIMLGKLGMSVEDCIKEYHDFSKKIFGKRHLRGKWSKGLARSRYSDEHLGNYVRDLLEKKSFGKDYPMICVDEADAIASFVHSCYLQRVERD